MKPPNATAAADPRHGQGRCVVERVPSCRDAFVSPLPPWDRTVDVVYHKHKHGDPTRGAPEMDFAKYLARFLSDHGCRRRREPGLMARLPPTVQFAICRHLVRGHGGSQGSKPIGLNRRCFDRQCWATSDLTPLGDVLAALQPYFGLSFLFYADVMLALLLDNTFHVTLSPFIGPRVSPFATTWLNKYGPYMRNIVVEVDLSRLGLGPAPAAAGLLPTLGHVEALLYDFSMSQMRRDASLPLESIILLCRRFHGPRTETLGRTSSMAGPVQTSRASVPDADKEATLPSHRATLGDSWNGSLDDWEVVKAAPSGVANNARGTASSSRSSDRGEQQQQSGYCPDAHLYICNHLARLRGRVDSVRMCGFGDKYTRQLIATLFPQAASSPAREHCYRVVPSTVWPSLPHQRLCVDAGPGRMPVILVGQGGVDDGDGQTVALATAACMPTVRPGPFQLPPPVAGPAAAILTSAVMVLAFGAFGAFDPTRSRIKRGSNTGQPQSKAQHRTGNETGAAYESEKTHGERRSRIQLLMERYGLGRNRIQRCPKGEAATTL